MSGRILVCCGPHSFPKVPDGDGSLPASLACSAALGQRHSSSLLLLPPLLSALLLLPSRFTSSFLSVLLVLLSLLSTTLSPLLLIILCLNFVQETRNILRKQLSGGQIMALQPGGIQGPGRAKASPGCHHTNGHGDREAVWPTQLH